MQVIYVGQPLGMVVAKTEDVARAASKWIQENAIRWHSVDPHPVLDLDEAIRNKRFFPDSTANSASKEKLYPKRLLKVHV